MEALGRLEENPFVARAYDLVQDRDDELLFYLVSEWVGPHTLADLLTRKTPHYSFGERLQLAVYLLDAVRYMHSRGIVHRDLHPGAIYLTQGTESEVPIKITDFDYARVANLPSILAEPSEVGTQGYIAPELWSGEQASHDHRVDIFSIGVVVAELLALERAFPSINDMLDHEQKWSEFRRLLPPGCAAVLDDFVRADPDDRLGELDEAIEFFGSLIANSEESI